MKREKKEYTSGESCGFMLSHSKIMIAVKPLPGNVVVMLYLNKSQILNICVAHWLIRIQGSECSEYCTRSNLGSIGRYALE